MLASLIILSSSAFLAWRALICAFRASTCACASAFMDSSSDVSVDPSVTDVRIEHSFVWAESVAPQVEHLYWVEPSDRVAPPEQVTLMAAASTP